MKYLYELKTELNMSYLDKYTFMNHVKNFAKKNLGISSDRTPFTLELTMPPMIKGSTVSHRLKDGSEIMGHVAINESQELYEMINTILHETKHIQQHIRKPLYYRFSHKLQQYLTKKQMYGGIFYVLALHEITARRYARKTMKKYNKELNALIEKAYNNELEELFY